MATKLLSTADVGQVLGIKQQAARNWLKRHGLPIVRVNQRMIRVREQDLDAWLANHRESAKPVQGPQQLASTGQKFLLPRNER